ncbi:hypothetical protein PR048_003508 [Dryococelus australis]|uniref:Uncharacterized protein n=1 Tax=Dryococelus australis TaxID=614101 RepID=A0ABQ9IQ71_9NEOP|nr:hypothetical protein PR048_003508 [Dryococelus australis]
MRVIEVNMERHRKEGMGETGDPRENPPAIGIVRHDSHLRKSAHRPIVIEDYGSRSSISNVEDFSVEGLVTISQRRGPDCSLVPGRRGGGHSGL